MSHVVIDTNIFIDLLNPESDKGAHINRLLVQLILNRYELLVDSIKKIAHEYEAMIIPIIRNGDETSAYLPILKYWMDITNWREQILVPTDNLMKILKRIIIERCENVDRAFVYVSCMGDCYLITNDGIHILDRHDEIMSCTIRYRGPNTDLIDSYQAFHILLNP
jgi:hypothetical protein